MQNDLLQWQITQSEGRLRERKIKPSQIKFHQSLPTRRASTERRKTKKYLFNNFVWNDLPQGQIRQREKGLREKNVKCPKSNFIRVCLKERFHREKKDSENFFCVFMQNDLCTFKQQNKLTFKTFQEFHSFLLISLLTKIIFRVSQKIHLLFLTIFPLNSSTKNKQK